MITYDRLPKQVRMIEPNMKGLELAQDAGLKEVVTIMSASESHNKKNINRSASESLSAYYSQDKSCLDSNAQYL